MDHPPYGHRREEEDEYPPRGPPSYGHRREEEDEYPPRGPPRYNETPNYNEPPQVTHVSHTSGGSYNYPPQENYPHRPTHNSHVGGEYGYPPPQETNYPPSASVHHVSHQSPYEAEEKPHHFRPHMSQETNYSPYPTSASVQHVSHESPQYEAENNPHHSRPHMPSFVPHHEPHRQEGSNVLANKPTVRIYSKAEPNYSLAIRDGNVILTVSNPSDPFQHWIKDEKYSLKVKDEEGYPSFALVNKATGEAIKHSTGATHPVQLTPYVPDKFDESILWTESKDLGDSYRTVRMVNNIRLNLDAFNGDKEHGGVRDGTTIVLWEWKKGDNQRWKIVPY